MKNLLHLIGYVKIKNMAVEVNFFEKIAILYLEGKSMFFILIIIS